VASLVWCWPSPLLSRRSPRSRSHSHSAPKDRPRDDVTKTDSEQFTQVGAQLVGQLVSGGMVLGCKERLLVCNGGVRGDVVLRNARLTMQVEERG
jgi:hypothetical protein